MRRARRRSFCLCRAARATRRPVARSPTQTSTRRSLRRSERRFGPGFRFTRSTRTSTSLPSPRRSSRPSTPAGPTVAAPPREPHCVAVRPPSSVSTCPVTNADASEQKKRIAPTRSSVSAIRPQRYAGYQTLVEVLVGEEALGLRNADEGRGDCVDGDPVLCPFSCVLAGQRVDCALGCDVRGIAGVKAELAPYGGKIEDAASVPELDHRPNGGLRGATSCAG